MSERRQVPAGDDLDVQVAAVDRPVPIGREQAVYPLPVEVDGGPVRRQGQIVHAQRHTELAGRLFDKEIEIVVGKLLGVRAPSDCPRRWCSTVGAIGRQPGPPQLADVAADDRQGCGDELRPGRRRQDQRRRNLDGRDVAGRFDPYIATAQPGTIGAGVDVQDVRREVEEAADGERSAGRDLHADP